MPDPNLQSWRAASAWDVVAIDPGRYGAEASQPGVSFEMLEHRDLATMIVQSGRQGPFAAWVSTRLGLPLPEVGRAAFGKAGAIIWSAPNQWLVVAPAHDDLANVRDGLEGIAAVTDQGDGRALVRISGPAARRTLAKSIAIDLHPDVFTAGSAATVAMAHVSVQLWAETDAPVYVLSVPRTTAGSIWSGLSASAAEFDYAIVREGADRQLG